MPDTFLSLDKSNKLRIPFVQGKFNMGGTGVFEFCGPNGLQLIVTRRNPRSSAASSTTRPTTSGDSPSSAARTRAAARPQLRLHLPRPGRGPTRRCPRARRRSPVHGGHDADFPAGPGPLRPRVGVGHAHQALRVRGHRLSSRTSSFRTRPAEPNGPAAARRRLAGPALRVPADTRGTRAVSRPTLPASASGSRTTAGTTWKRASRRRARSAPAASR